MSAIFEDKTIETLKSINDVSEEFKLEAHILRFWETKFPQLKPIKAKGNRRLYSENDIQLIQTIRDLLYNQGYTIEGAKKYLRNGGTAQMQEPANDSFASNDKVEIRSVIADLESIRNKLRQII